MAGGFYGALDIGKIKIKDTCTYLNSQGTLGCKDSSTASRIGGGYQFTPMWGTEISYGNYGKESMGTFLGTAVGDWKMSGVQVSGTGTLPLGGGFDLIGKAGIARTKYEITGSPANSVPPASNTSTKLTYGIGAQYNVSSRVAIRTQYEDLGEVGEGDFATCAACTGTTKATLLTAGVVVKF